MPAPMPPWMSASEAPTTWMLRMARNAPIVEPITATHVLNDARSAAGAGARTMPPSTGIPSTEAAGERVAVVDMRHSAAQCTAIGAQVAVDAPRTFVLVSMDASTDI